MALTLGASLFCGDSLAVFGFDSQVKDVNQPGFKISPRHLRMIDGNDVAGQPVFSEPEADELFELFDPACPADFVVVPVKSETDPQIPAEPDTRHHQADQSRH